MLTPLLIFPSSYQEIVVTAWGQRPAVHESPHPMGLGGPTLEYYTKLSHFSLGADIDALYVIGLDLGVSGVGYLKYTF